jgi:hypothetical protein
MNSGTDVKSTLLPGTVSPTVTVEVELQKSRIFYFHGYSTYHIPVPSTVDRRVQFYKRSLQYGYVDMQVYSSEVGGRHQMATNATTTYMCVLLLVVTMANPLLLVVTMANIPPWAVLVALQYYGAVEAFTARQSRYSRKF